MMTPAPLVPMLSLLFTITGLWVLFFELYKPYRVDAFRQSVFAIRDELFDYALGGHIPFDHPSYQSLRRHMNGMIRFAHRLTLVWVITMALARILRPTPEVEEKWLREHEHMFENAPIASRAAIRQFHDRAVLLAMEHLLLTSLVFWFAVIPIIVVGIIRTIWRGGAMILAPYFPGRRLIDNEAAELGSLA